DEQSEIEFDQAQTTAQTPNREELLNLIQLSSAIKETEPTKEQLRVLHACIKKVTEDLEHLRFNTALSALMVFVNEAMTWQTRSWSVLRDFVILLHPFAPHLAEELWAVCVLDFFNIASPHHSHTPPLHHSITPPLHHSTTPSLYPSLPCLRFLAKSGIVNFGLCSYSPAHDVFDKTGTKRAVCCPV